MLASNQTNPLARILLIAGVFAGACLVGYFATVAALDLTVPAPSPTINVVAANVTATLTPSRPITPTLVQVAAKPSPFPTTKQPTNPEPFIAAHQFLFARPLPVDADTPYPSPVYLYGTTQLFALQVHHGNDFDLNPRGMKILAVANGTIVTAGDDNEPICGQPNANTLCGPTAGFYGNVVAIQLDLPQGDQPTFAFYGHLETLGVTRGDHVKTGDQIGTLGDTGTSALGPHLHLEARVDVNDYSHTRNPGLWVRPLPGRGILAGAATDSNGLPLRAWVVDLYRAERPDVYWLGTETYQRDDKPAVNSDKNLGENFVMPDLQIGKYIVVLRQGQHSFTRTVTIEEGEITFLPIGF